MSTEVVSTFDSSMYVTELLARSLENSALDVTHRAVTALAAKYGFSAEEAIADLGLSKLSLTKKQMAKKGSKGEKVPKVKAAKAEKLAFMLPFCGVVNEAQCPGLQFNGGLFTQCKHERGSCESGFCKKCGEQAAKNASGVPDCGTVGQRLTAELMAFRDPKGRAPVSYAKYMEKKGISVEQVTEAASALGWNVPEEHFAAPVKKTKAAKTPKTEGEGPKKRGRPKKDAKVVEASSVDDLFATLAAEAASPKENSVVFAVPTSMETDAASSSDDESTGSNEKKATKAKKPKMSDAEKAAAKEAKEAEKLAAKLAKELEAKQAKMAKEAEKAAAKEAKEAEKLAAKAAKEAEKLAAKAAKEAAKPAKAAKAPKAPKDEAESAAPAAAEPVKKKVTVTPFSFEGKNYLRSAEGIVYDAETKDDVGMWNEATKEVEFFAEDGELSEEEEDEDEEA